MQWDLPVSTDYLDHRPLRLGRGILFRLLLILITLVAVSYALAFALWPRTNPNDGFGGFAPSIAGALTSADGSLFATKAGIDPSSSVLNVVHTPDATPSAAYVAGLLAWIDGARADLSDAYGSGATRLHAIACTMRSDVGPFPCGGRASVLTSIQDTEAGPQRQVRVLTWIKYPSGWRIWGESPVDSAIEGSTTQQWLEGTCRLCSRDWELYK